MAATDTERLLEAFAAAGNRVDIKPGVTFKGGFTIKWGGGGSVLEIDEGATVSTATLVFNKGGGIVRIGRGATAKGRLEVGEGGEIRIGEGTFMNRICDIRGFEGGIVDIGRNCLFSDVKVQTSDMHSILDAATGKRTNPAAGIVIEDDVWLAEEVKVGKGVRIGTGSIIAAGSLVTRSIAPFCVAAGRPAKVIRAGVAWSRKRLKAETLPAPEFQPADIPFNKDILRHLVKTGHHALVEAVILAQNQEDLPLFARWYLVFVRHQLNRPQPEARAVLDQIIAEAPDHKAARALRARLGG